MKKKINLSAVTELTSANREQAPVLANLLELYAHDFSEYAALQIGADGRFGYERLPLYWSEPHRHPFLILCRDQMAGFAFVQQGSQIAENQAVFDMAEFFILRGYRGCGVGTEAAHQLWKRFPGPWEIRVQQSNIPARRFWSGAIATFNGKTIRPARIEKDGKLWQLFSFTSHLIP